MSEERISFAEGIDREAAVERAVAVLQRDGVVVLDDLVEPALLATCRAEVEAAHPDLAVPDRERNYGPYEGRHCMPMRVADTLADRAIFVPRAVEMIAARLLGATFMVDSVGLLVAVPGAPDQIGHADATLYGEAIDRLVPPFALAFSLPLVPMDEVSGRTAFWRGSHRKPATAEAHDYAPTLLPGSAVLWDFRTRHCGLANHGTAPRPVIFTVLSREWWVEIAPPEATRYEKFIVARDVRDALKPRLQQRIRRATLVD